MNCSFGASLHESHVIVFQVSIDCGRERARANLCTRKTVSAINAPKKAALTDDTPNAIAIVLSEAPVSLVDSRS